MIIRSIAILTPIGGLILAGAAFGDELRLSAAEAQAIIAPRVTPRKEVPLPTLDLEIRAMLDCVGEPVSVTLSVADVHRSFAADAVSDDGVLETTIRVPADQLALVIAGSSFCLGEPAQAGETLLVPGVATAQGSLQCAAEAGISMHYASTPVPLRLTCVGPQPVDQPESLPAR